MTNKFIEIAVITAAHGTRGQVRLKSFTARPETVLTYDTLTDAGGQRHYAIRAQGSAKSSQLIVSIDGVTDRNAAELLKGAKLYIPAESLPETDGGWYYAELIGLEARLSDGAVYGKIIAVHNFGAGDIIELELPDGTNEMLPLNDDFVPEIQADKGYIVITPPEYLEAK